MSPSPDRRSPRPDPPSDPARRDDLSLLGGGAVAALGMALPRNLRNVLSLGAETPSGPPAEEFAPAPSGADRTVLLDARWSLLAEGRGMTLREFRTRLREGPMSFWWMGSQEGPGLFSASTSLTPGEARLDETRRLRAASTLCPVDGASLRYLPRDDRWYCPGCSSEFAGRDGRVLSGPATKPLLTFFLGSRENEAPVILRPPGARTPP